jgi:hypothetical protein
MRGETLVGTLKSLGEVLPLPDQRGVGSFVLVEFP